MQKQMFQWPYSYWQALFHANFLPAIFYYSKHTRYTHIKAGGAG